MTDWTSGYVADIGYTYGYYGELNPLRLRLAMLNAGLRLPEVNTACELGFGQGISVNMHAAASATEWYGTDFNPSQASFARELVAASGAGAKLYDEAFADFTKRLDLPDFDYIGLHGIWSWISDENRGVIVDFIRRRLKVGGVLYISYNTLPGWSGFAPIRHLMVEQARMFGAEGHGIVKRIEGTMEFVEKLVATNPQFLRANPAFKERFDRIKTQDRNYLAHEFFNRDWHPMYFATLAEWLAPSKVQYGCSAYYPDYVDAINLSEGHISFLAEIPDPMFRQSMRDFMVNQQFRRDYWIKGARRLVPLEQADELRRQRVVLAAHRPDVLLKITGALGEATLSTEIYNPILDVLSDHKPRSVGQIEKEVKGKGIRIAQVIQALLMLIGQGTLMAIQEDAVISKARKSSERLNAFAKLRARSGADIGYLASPVTGGGVAVGRFQQLFLLAIEQGRKQPTEWAEFVWQTLYGQGHRVLKDGKTLEAADENLAELNRIAGQFAEKQLPILKALQVA